MDMRCVYVVGGIVDRTPNKGVSVGKAQRLKVCNLKNRVLYYLNLEINVFFVLQRIPFLLRLCV